MATQQFELLALERKHDPFLALIDKAMDKNPDVVGQMLDHYERWRKLQAKQAYDEAMLAFKKAVPAIVKSRIADMAGKYQYKYAPLEEVCEKLDPVLVAHGFDYRWKTKPHDKGVVVVCVLNHFQGHSEDTEMPPSPHDTSGGKNPIQAIGSTLSYLQRYSLLMACGIAPKNTDTDGKIAQPKQGGKMNETELKERLAYFNKCATYQEVDAHYKASFGAAHEAKDQDAKDAFISAKKTAYARLREIQR